ncbi:MAG TPA: hypothetical protein VFS09_03270 [Candidatus Eisenbacteria bacterium]|nr:hypothetical protein [Candidatus Eisenbacteria bacterium]
MNRKDFERIANDELDGVATPAESESLRRHLAENAGAREEFEALREVFQRLNRVELEEAPPGLRQSVLQATVAQRREAAPVNRNAWAKTFLGGLLQAPNLRGAMTFASGLGVGAAAIAIVAGSLVGGRHADFSGMTGTMAPPKSESAGRLLESRTLELNGIKVTADTRRTADGVILRIEATGTGASGARIAAAFDRGALLPVALRMDPQSADEFEIGASSLWFTLSGAGTHTLSLRSESAHSAPLDLELRAGGESVRTKLRTDFSESR